jgi:hypothetical protein
MATSGPNLGLIVNETQGVNWYDEAVRLLRGLDGLIQCSVLDKDLTAPPGSPSDGDRYIVGASATGDWATNDGKIARYSSVEAGWEFFAPNEGWSAYVRDEDARYTYDGSAWSVAASDTEPEVIVIACSDETTDLTTGTATVTFRVPFAMTLSSVRASVTTAPTGAALTVDINEAGVSILSTKLTIDVSEKTSTTAATPAVLSDTGLADDAEITIDIDQVGSTVAGAGLKVYLIGSRA